MITITRAAREALAIAQERGSVYVRTARGNELIAERVVQGEAESFKLWKGHAVFLVVNRVRTVNGRIVAADLPSSRLYRAGLSADALVRKLSKWGAVIELNPNTRPRRIPRRRRVRLEDLL